jgi:predicted ATPase
LVEQRQEEIGMAQIRQGLDAYREIGSDAAAVQSLTGLSRAYATVGKFQEALSVLSEALAEVGASEHQTWAAEVYRLKGELLLDLCRVADHSPRCRCAEAEASLVLAIETARAQEAKSFELAATTSLCRLWQAQGKHAEAHALLSAIYGWFTEGFDTADLIEAKALLEVLN